MVIKTNNCIFHGNYTGSECEQCKKLRNNKTVIKDSSFGFFMLKGTILLALSIGLGWFLYSL